MVYLRLDRISGPLPTSTFDIFFDRHRVGMIQVRHRLSAGAGMPAEFASHVYYEIDPEYRGNGYAAEALLLAILEAARIGLREVVVGCSTSNPASQRTIEKAGGTFVAEVQDVGTALLRKYSFKTDLVPQSPSMRAASYTQCIPQA